MALPNITHTVKRDEVGKVMNFTLKADGSLVDLSSYTVTMTLIDKDGNVATSAASVTKRTQSGSTLGQCYHTWSAATIPNANGIYQGELKLVAGSNVLYWPVDENNERTYFKVKVQGSLS